MHPSRVLILSERALTELPPLKDVAELHTLDVGHNRLTSVPRLPDISGYLNVSANPIRVLPARIGDMRGLIELRAERCGLTTLPASIGKLHALHELALRDNAIAEPPAEIGELPNLRRLDLRNNGLRSLPPSVGELPHLDKLDLRWNPGLETLWLEALERRGCVIWR